MRGPEGNPIFDHTALAAPLSCGTPMRSISRHR